MKRILFCLLVVLVASVMLYISILDLDRGGDKRDQEQMKSWRMQADEYEASLKK